jgi:O-antigen ligase
VKQRSEAPAGAGSPSGRLIISHGGALSAVALAALLLWAPWPFASVTQWAQAILFVGVAAAFALALFDPAAPAALRLTAPPAAALAALALLGLAQSLPWPAWLAGLVSPGHGVVAREAAAGLAPYGDAGGPGFVRLSLAPVASRWSALWLAALAAALAAATVVGRHRPGRRLLTAALLLAALAQVFYGAPRWLAGADSLWGVFVGGGQRLRGSFVNPNHFALYLEMALAVAFAWSWWTWSRAAREGMSPEHRVTLVAPPLLVWLTLFLALAFTGSRAGVLAGAAAVVAQGMLAAFRRGLRRRRVRWALVGVLVALCGLAAVAFAGFEAGLGRLAATSPFDLGWEVRTGVYRHTLELWGRFPLLGTGLGTFVHGFPLVQPESLALFWRHAHSDPLELLAVGGLVGVLAAGLGVAALVVRLLRVLRKGRRREDQAAALAALGALAAVGLHELADFGLTMPANALTLAVLCGAAAGAAVEEPGGGGRHRLRRRGTFRTPSAQAPPAEPP